MSYSFNTLIIFSLLRLNPFLERDMHYFLIFFHSLANLESAVLVLEWGYESLAVVNSCSDNCEEGWSAELWVLRVSLIVEFVLLFLILGYYNYFKP